MTLDQAISIDNDRKSMYEIILLFDNLFSEGKFKEANQMLDELDTDKCSSGVLLSILASSSWGQYEDKMESRPRILKEYVKRLRDKSPEEFSQSVRCLSDDFWQGCRPEVV